MQHSRFPRGLLAVLLTTAIPARTQSVGPLVGRVSTDSAHLLYRPGDEERVLRLEVLDSSGAPVAVSTADATTAGDLVAHFSVTGLKPDTPYGYRIGVLDPAGSVAWRVGGDASHGFRTCKPAGVPGVVSAAIVSCANASTAPVWRRIAEGKPDVLVLAGDTPYIDTADLREIRRKHREFLAQPDLAALLRNTSTLGTWDDHDFGRNNGNGASFLEGKPHTRRGFLEYRANGPRAGEGIQNRADLGALDLFLLDPRWYSQTAPSPVDRTQPTCFGAEQWQWLKDGLAASRAPFKVLLMGQVWQDKGNAETDDMHTYWYERDALFDFIAERRISGVVLVGGDIHLSRHLVHRQRLGYDLHDFITSPAHTSTIASLDVYHPDLEWSAVLPNQFLTLETDTRAQPPVLTARFNQGVGPVLRTVRLPLDELTPRAPSGLSTGLRAWWSFERDGTNASPQGERLNAVAVNGATLGATPGSQGKAASFARAQGQYLVVPRGALDDASARHTLSLWCRPDSLPAADSRDRAFLLESTPTGTVTEANSGYALSLGFRAAAAPEQINLQLHTRTLAPATKPQAAPEDIAQGGFDTLLDRRRFANRWTHLAQTFDGTRLRLFVDGARVAEHALPKPGPLAPNGGLVIGGHRAGTGRNFDGAIDEVALWSRVLTDAEILSLSQGQAPSQPLPAKISEP